MTETPIEQFAPERGPDEPISAGVDDGTILETTTHDGEAVQEVIVEEKNAAGEVIGWHKELLTGA